MFIKGLGVGGAERLLERAIPYLDHEQFDYQVAYLMPQKDALVAPFRAAGIPVHCLNLGAVIDPGAMSRLMALLKRAQFHLIHAHLPMPGVMARIAKRCSAVRHVVYTEHNLPSRYRVITRVLNRATYLINDVVIAVSDAVAEQVKPYVGGGATLLKTIPNAIDVEMFRAADRDAVCKEFGFPADAHIVISVGNLKSVKGHKYLLAAAKLAIAQEPRARFLVVGTGPLAVRLAEEANRLGLGNRVVFAGFRPDAASLVGAADLFVLSSLYEGLPVSLLEAMALGRPAVLTRVGGIPEVVVPGETAVLVDPKDAAGLAGEIVSLLRSPGRRSQMGEKARRHVSRRYGVAQMVTAIEDVYRQVEER